MDFDALMLILAAEKQPHQLSMNYMRKLFHMVRAFRFMVLSCTLFCLATCGPCLIDGLQKSTDYNGCGSYKDDHAAAFHDIIVADASAGLDSGSLLTQLSVKNICSGSHSFCFPSTLPGFSSEDHKPEPEDLEVPSGLSSIGSMTQGSNGPSNKSRFSDSGMFELINGQTVSCSLSSIEGSSKLSTTDISSVYQNDLSSCGGPLRITRSTNNPNPIDVSLSPYVEIVPPLLDYGHKNLYSPSVAFLTITNLCNDSVLHVYEPFSTDLQFYHCNFSEFHLGPGEVASICLVFLPRSLGLSSAHLILQTNFGGFLVEVKGYAVESPFKISPVISLDSDSSGRLIKNLSLFNPFDENLYVREVIAWLSVSHGNISYQTVATCRVEKYQDFDISSLLSVKDWLVLNSAEVGLPLMGTRPHESWEIGPYSSETVIEIEFPFESETQIFGAFSMQLARSSLEKSENIMVPVEIDLNGKFSCNGINDFGSISVSLEALVPRDAKNTVISISLRNRAPHLLSVVEISEFATVKNLLIKYVQGLLLFPGTDTRVATIGCARLLVGLHDSGAEMANLNGDCKLVLLTNDSSIPEIEIPCQNIIHICLRHQEDSTIGFNLQSEKAQSGNRRLGSLGSDMWFSSKFLCQFELKGLDNIETDEFVLENWKTHGTSRTMSVLDDHELLFPVVEVGTQQSKWITVKNPSEQPVLMQLVLNSGQIIDNCKNTDVLLIPISSASSVQNSFPRSKYGFSMANNAQSEALVHPDEKVSFGPILFHPSNRCGWTSTALIRNNLSGVEWLSLKGFGGSLSLAVFEESNPVHIIEFNLGLPFPLNVSSPDIEEANRVCSQSVSKELYAKNTGDLPLEVKSIKVSGTECELDGFAVHNCNGFSLEPGESTKLLVSYQSDFYAAMLQRDLELALASGILVIPMKASLSLFMFNVCKKSVFWMRLKKFSVVAFFSASLMFLILFCWFPQVVNFGSQDHFYRSPESSGKSPRLHRNQSSSKISLAAEMNSLLKSASEKSPSKQKATFKFPESPLGESEGHKVVQSVMSDTAALEAPQPCSLTVRIGKEKGKRRKKRKGPHANLSGLFEVSSSQSGNSTPSSPLSPASTTPNRRRSPSPTKNADMAARNPFTQAVNQKSTTRATVTESKLSEKYSSKTPSTTKEAPVFPSPGKAVMPNSPASTSRVAPHARAPGPKHQNVKKVEEKLGNENLYDIWGDHFSGIHLVGSSKDVTVRKTVPVATENSSSSFFVMGPQALVTRQASCFQEEG